MELLEQRAGLHFLTMRLRLVLLLHNKDTMFREVLRKIVGDSDANQVFLMDFSILTIFLLPNAPPLQEYRLYYSASETQLVEVFV